MTLDDAVSQILQMRGGREQRDLVSALGEAQQRYPRIADIPMALTTGIGPGSSETYGPGEDSNPYNDRWDVELRDPKVIANRSLWPDYIGLESLHPLQKNDPYYQVQTQNFINSMTPSQMLDTHRAYARDKAMFHDTQPFETWLPKVQAQEYLRGMMFPDAIKNWTGPEGEGRYTPHQLQIGGQLSDYLKGGPQ